MASDRVLTHHVNVKNPKNDKVSTFEPGEELPGWAADILVAENHAAYPERSTRSEASVKGWNSSKLAAEAAADLSA
jgi:hypothetical protein